MRSVTLDMTKFSISSNAIPTVFTGRGFLVCFYANKLRCIFHKLGSATIMSLIYLSTEVFEGKND